MKCIVCGCTDEQACPSGCAWIIPEVCSRCYRLYELINSVVKASLRKLSIERIGGHGGIDEPALPNLRKWLFKKSSSVRDALSMVLLEGIEPDA